MTRGFCLQRLLDRQFVRIHRSTIVNLEHVERLEPWSHASQRVYLRGLSEPLTMSRRFGARLRECRMTPRSSSLPVATG